MTLTILGLGTATPPTVVDQADAARIHAALAGLTADESMKLHGLYRHTGIRQRHTVLGPKLIADLLAGTRHSGSPFLPGSPGGPTTAERMRIYRHHAGPLAIEASRRALRESGVRSEAITHLITVSCTGFTAPGIDRELNAALGLSPSVERTHVGYMGCHGALNGLRVARAFHAETPTACVLLASVELCTLHLYYGREPEPMVSNALFADGAAAAMLGAGEGWQVMASGSCVIPETASDMTWNVGDHGFQMTLSRRVPGLIARHLKPWLDAWLGRQGLSVETVGSWAVHPGGPRILSAVEETLEIPADALATSRAVLAEYGNMSSPTLLFIVQRLIADRARTPCVMLGFGPGLAVEAALLTA